MNDECSIETVEIVNKTADENVETTNAVLACALEAEPNQDAVEQENIINVLGSDPITLTNTEEEIVVVKNEQVPNIQSETITLSVSGNEQVQVTTSESTDISAKSDKADNSVTNGDVSKSVDKDNTENLNNNENLNSGY